MRNYSRGVKFSAVIDHQIFFRFPNFLLFQKDRVDGLCKATHFLFIGLRILQLKTPVWEAGIKIKIKLRKKFSNDLF